MKGNFPRISIVLDRLRSAYNTGNIFRIAEAVCVYEIIACGYTPYPPHPKLEKTAMGSDKMVKYRHFATSLEAVRALRSEGYKMALAVDNIEGAVCAWDKKYEFPLGLVFGNEALGISDDALSECDGIINLPMFGAKSSINVGNCASAVLYGIVKQVMGSSG